MTDPLPDSPPDPIVLDSSVLVAYEWMKTPGAGVMNEAQSRIAEWLLRGVPLLVPALSLVVASNECSGDLSELDLLMRGDSDLVLTVPLARESAIDVGATSAALEAEHLEIAHVVWCASGHDEDDHSASWPVATYWPDWYAGARVPVIPL